MGFLSSNALRRLGLILGNGLAVGILAWLLWDEGAAVAAESPRALPVLESLVGAAQAEPGAGGPGSVDGRQPVATLSAPVGPISVPIVDARPPLRRGVETAIANAVVEAARRSKNKVSTGSATIAVCVVDAKTGRELVGIQADRPLRPASNLKILTTAAALVLLGSDASYETPIESRGSLQQGVLTGDLVARAGGDPLFRQNGDGGLEPWLDGLARELSHAGIRRVRGRLVLDEGSFEDPAPGPAWPSSREYWKDYCALAGGFSANAGCLTANVSATRSGSRADVAVRPRHHGLARRGEVETVGSKAALNVAVGATATAVTVRGKIPSSVKHWDARFAAPDPVALFGSAVVGGLAERGIEIEGGYVRQRSAPGGKVVASMHSPISDSVIPILTHSNNAVADQLFLTLGLRVAGVGTRAGGAQAVGQALDQLGLERGGWKQVGGSGLSRDNRVSARQLCGLLQAARGVSGAARELFDRGMPIAGETGTLASRMRKSVARGRVHAKTGFINGTSALSGWLTTEAGRELIFSILVEYPTFEGLNTHCWKPMQDRICEELVDDVD
ncbi:MAG: D-alanyl-D-alanine carboxypeptidase/D-alanyl-D-alanine-endopeptidase (penicillin-binding protein 4) [Chlamydiales bacterium]|jgi:D-alanyl-D-alanine carboxypeptidase/D-alanyl-D-alanine-endopeptidase (penicillin-binding protein 4)